MTNNNPSRNPSSEPTSNQQQKGRTEPQKGQRDRDSEKDRMDKNAPSKSPLNRSEQY